jgi:hypothetical protein
LGKSEEAVMALARVVAFDEVTKARIEEMQREMREGERPDEIPATEVVLLHDPDADKALVVLFFDSEEDYQRGDEFLSAMPADETPGRRTAVTKYDVAVRMST